LPLCKRVAALTALNCEVDIMRATARSADSQSPLLVQPNNADSISSDESEGDDVIPRWQSRSKLRRCESFQYLNTYIDDDEEDHFEQQMQQQRQQQQYPTWRYKNKFIRIKGCIWPQWPCSPTTEARLDRQALEDAAATRPPTAASIAPTSTAAAAPTTAAPTTASAPLHMVIWSPPPPSQPVDQRANRVSPSPPPRPMSQPTLIPSAASASGAAAATTTSTPLQWPWSSAMFKSSYSEIVKMSLFASPPPTYRLNVNSPATAYLLASPPLPAAAGTQSINTMLHQLLDAEDIAPSQFVAALSLD